MFKSNLEKINNQVLKVCVEVKNFIEDKKGVTAIEYALIAVAISSMLFLVLGNPEEGGLVNKIKEAFQSIQDGLSVSQKSTEN